MRHDEVDLHGLLPRHARLRRVQTTLDALATLVAAAAAPALHDLAAARFPALRTLAPFREYALFVYLALPLWPLLAMGLGLHRTFERPPSWAEAAADLLRFHVVGVLILGGLHFATNAIVNRSLVAAFLAASYVLMLLQRGTLGAWRRLQLARGRDRAVLLCIGQPSSRMQRFLDAAARGVTPPEVIGYLADDAPADGLSQPPPGAPVPPKLGTLRDLEATIQRHAVNHVVFFAPYQHPEAVPAELATCEELGIPASFVIDLRQLSRTRPRITELYEHCVVEFEVASKSPEALALKHGLDPLLALLLLVVLAPLLVGVAAAIAVSMGRPVLYVQERAGRFGRPFRMLKFRTMRPGAERERAALLDQNEMSGPVFKITADPRVTPLGRLLRATSIDELPQLFNVLAGSMSLVGPRPLPVQEQDQISGWQRRRLSMKPGLTCLWQISGRSGIDFEEWMLLDLRYVEDWSLGLDLVILMRTVPAVLWRRGAR